MGDPGKVIDAYLIATSNKMDYVGKVINSLRVGYMLTGQEVHRECLLRGRWKDVFSDCCRKFMELVEHRRKDARDFQLHVLNGVSEQTFKKHLLDGKRLVDAIESSSERLCLGMEDLDSLELVIRKCGEANGGKKGSAQLPSPGTQRWLEMYLTGSEILAGENEGKIPAVNNDAEEDVKVIWAEDGSVEEVVVSEDAFFRCVDLAGRGPVVELKECTIVSGSAADGEGCQNTDFPLGGFLACFRKKALAKGQVWERVREHIMSSLEVGWLATMPRNKKRKVGEASRGRKGGKNRVYERVDAFVPEAASPANGVMVKRRLRAGNRLDCSQLWKGEVPLFFLFERVRKGFAMRKSDGHEFLSDANISGICKLYSVPVIGCPTFIVFKESKVTPHGFVCGTEVGRLAGKGSKEGVTCVNLSKHGNYTEDDIFLRVVRYGTELFSELFLEDCLVLDPKQIVLKVLAFHGMKPGIGKKRQNFRFDGGFADHAPEVEHLQGTAVCSCKLINKEETELYHLAGSVVELMDQAVMSLGRNDPVPPFSNPLRDSFPKFLASFCGLPPENGLKSEGFSLCVSIVGNVVWKHGKRVLDFDPSMFPGKHSDGQNCDKPGYDASATFSMFVEIDGIVYRVSIVSYNRFAIGNIVQREYGIANVILERCRAYHKKVGDYRTFVAGLEKEETLRIKAAAGYEKVEIAAVKKPAFGNKCGYYSSFVDGIRRLKESAGLGFSSGLHLLLAALMCNGQAKFQYITQLWLSGESDIFRQGMADRTSFVQLFYRECVKRGFGTQGGPISRHSSAAGCWPGICQAEFESQDPYWEPVTENDRIAARNETKCLEETVRRLRRFLVLADKQAGLSTQVLLDQMCLSPADGGIEHIGQITCQAVFPLAVMCGFVKDLNRATYGFVAEGSPVFDQVEDFARLTREVRDGIISGIAMKLKESKFVVECLCCEAYRRHQHYDLFFGGQKLFGVWPDGRGVLRVWCKEYHGSTWTVAESVDWK